MKNKTKEKEIGTRIMNLRLDRGYSKEYLARNAGISVRFLREIENSRKGFSANTLVRLAEVLEVSTDYIMTGRSSGGCDERIAMALGKFEPDAFGKVGQLLELVYEIAHTR